MNQSENAIVDELQRQGFKYPTIAKMTGLSIYKVKHYCRTHVINESEIKKTATAFCKCCGMPIESIPKRKPKQFCSDSCRMKWWNSHRDRVNHKHHKKCVCKNCGAEFMIPGKRTRPFCSKDCYFAFRKKAVV